MVDSYAKTRLKMFLLLNFYANANSTEPYLFISVSAGGELFFPFPTIYVIEVGLSTLTMVKTNYGNRLQSEDEIICL